MADKGDTFNISGGQMGAVGTNAHAHDMTFNQIWNQSGQEIDLSALAGELSKLRAELKKAATEPEHDEVIGAIASAEKAAKEKDGPKALEYLSAAGKWAMEIGIKLGVPIAVEAIKKAMMGP